MWPGAPVVVEEVRDEGGVRVVLGVEIQGPELRCVHGAVDGDGDGGRVVAGDVAECAVCRAVLPELVLEGARDVVPYYAQIVRLSSAVLVWLLVAVEHDHVFVLVVEHEEHAEVGEVFGVDAVEDGLDDY